MIRINWESLLWETRGYLGIEDTDPVPVRGLRKQAKANGYDEREIRKALRDTDALESLGDDPDALRVRLTEESGKGEKQAVKTPEDADPPGSNPGGETDKPGSSNGRDALRDALEWFHQQLDRDLPEECSFATPRAYYREGRGWDADTIDEKLLGYAPATYKDDLIAYLFDSALHVSVKEVRDRHHRSLSPPTSRSYFSVQS